MMREWLASLGKTIADQEYAYMPICSLPPLYEMILHGLNAAAKPTGQAIGPKNVVHLVGGEYNHRTLKKGLQGSDDTFVMTSTQKGKKKKHNVECFNCHKCGHVKADCWAKGGSKEGQGPWRSGSAAARVNSSASAQEADIGAWAAIEEISEEAASSTAEEPERRVTMAASSSARAPMPEAELYDSGASRHMSPYQHRFETYWVIPPRAIMATDKKMFYGVGIGDLRIKVPRGKSHSVVLLRDVLHAPDMGMTMVSIRCIAKAGCMVSFKGRSCNITGSSSKTIRTIPANANRLYKVEHDFTVAGCNGARESSHTPPGLDPPRLQLSTPLSATTPSRASN
jgi:hypothetical protein